MKKKISERRSSRNRRLALLLFLMAMGAIAALLYFEQVAVIYLMTTVALIILLLIVAFADLENVGRGDELEDSAELLQSEARNNQALARSAEDLKRSEMSEEISGRKTGKNF